MNEETGRPDLIAEKVIGTGANSVVFKCRVDDDNAQSIVALKKITLVNDPIEDKEIVKEWEQEVHMLRAVNHRNIVKCLSFHRTVACLFIVMDFADGGSLAQWMKRNGPLPSADAAFVMKQVLLAVSSLHKHNLIHADVKAANMLLQSSSTAAPPDLPVEDEAATLLTIFNYIVKISDFGLTTKSVTLGPGAAGNLPLRGSPHWMAPELISQQSPFTFATDVWALGALAFELVTGNPPFFDRSRQNVLFHVANLTEPPVSEWQGKPMITQEMVDFFLHTMQPDPANRASVEELLQHPWIRQGDAGLMAASTASIPQYADLPVDGTEVFAAMESGIVGSKQAFVKWLWGPEAEAHVPSESLSTLPPHLHAALPSRTKSQQIRAHAVVSHCVKLLMKMCDTVLSSRNSSSSGGGARYSPREAGEQDAAAAPADTSSASSDTLESVVKILVLLAKAATQVLLVQQQRSSLVLQQQDEAAFLSTNDADRHSTSLRTATTPRGAFSSTKEEQWSSQSDASPTDVAAFLVLLCSCEFWSIDFLTIFPTSCDKYAAAVEAINAIHCACMTTSESCACKAGSAVSSILFLLGSDYRPTLLRRMVQAGDNSRAAHGLPSLEDTICLSNQLEIGEPGKENNDHQPPVRNLPLAVALPSKWLRNGLQPMLSGFVEAPCRTLVSLSSGDGVDTVSATLLWEEIDLGLYFILLLTADDPSALRELVQDSFFAAVILEAVAQAPSRTTALLTMVRLANLDPSIAVAQFKVYPFLTAAIGDGGTVQYSLRVSLARALIPLRSTTAGREQLEHAHSGVPLLGALLQSSPPVECAVDPFVVIFNDLCDDSHTAAACACDSFLRAVVAKLRAAEEREATADVFNVIALLQALFAHAPDPTLFSSSPDLCGILVSAAQNGRYPPQVIGAICTLLNACSAVAVF